MRILTLFFTGLHLLATSAAPVPSNLPVVVNVRIEGFNSTVFEGPVLTRGHDVTTKAGGTHRCNGLNKNENPIAGPTCTSALDDASRSQRVFSYDGEYFDDFDDFAISKIGNDEQTDTQFWGLLLNYQLSPVGGCQQQVRQGQDVLWAFDAFNKRFFLKARGPSVAQVGKPVVYTVVDGTTGNPIKDALIGGSTTDSAGKATVVFKERGKQVLKAELPDAVRSNGVVTLVL